MHIYNNIIKSSCTKIILFNLIINLFIYLQYSILCSKQNNNSINTFFLKRRRLGEEEVKRKGYFTIKSIAHNL